MIFLDAKQKLIALAAVLTILGSVLWIYRHEFGGPEFNVALQEVVGQVLAEQTSRLLPGGGRVVIITMEKGNAPELKAQLGAFEKALKSSHGLAIQETVTLDPGDNPKFRPGSGLSAKRFLKIVRKHPTAGAFVSFVGAPQLSDTELAQLKSAPTLIAETHSPEKLLGLFEKKVLLAAVVPRFEFPAPGPRKPHTGRELFDYYFQVVAPGATLPSEDPAP
jgi:hypothetical protein